MNLGVSVFRPSIASRSSCYLYLRPVILYPEGIQARSSSYPSSSPSSARSCGYASPDHLKASRKATISYLRLGVAYAHSDHRVTN